MTVSIRAIGADEVERFRVELSRTFGSDVEPGDSATALFGELIELDRSIGAFDGDALVATATAFSLALAVPGAVMPMGGLSMVTVRPTHRRQGILRALIQAHLEDVAARGEPVSGLWASESSIYERFGYGIAAESDILQLDATALDVTVPGAPDDIELIDATTVIDELGELHDELFARRAGGLRRSRPWWQLRFIEDPPERRRGASKRRWVVARRDGRTTGWVCYRQRQKFEGGIAAGTVEIAELVGVDAIAEASLWRFVVNIDLFPDVRYWNAPTDALIKWLTPQRRRLSMRRTDTLWLRPCDVAAMLAGRTYGADGRLVIALRDGGAFALSVDGGRAQCAASDEHPTLTCERSALGSILLGGVAPSLLARSGRIEGSERALAEADRMFASPVPPWCPEMF